MKRKAWGIPNLVMAGILIFMIIWAFTFEIAVWQKYVKSLEGNDQQLGGGIGMAVAIIFFLIASVGYGVCSLLLIVSGVGILKSGKKGFLIVGIVGKFIALAPFVLAFALTMSWVSRVLYIVLMLAYLAGGILDIIFHKELR